MSSTTHTDQRLRQALLRLSIIIFCTAALSSIVFQSTTFALPKVLDERLSGIAGSATVVGWLAFVVFAIASLAQLVVGRLLDTLGPRIVFMAVAALQVAFFLLMPGLTDWTALAVALGFMLGAFGQIPINDYMIGRMARSEFRGAVYGARYVVSFVALAAALPLIAWVHGNWGFDALFRILAATAAVIFSLRVDDPRHAAGAGRGAGEGVRVGSGKRRLLAPSARAGYESLDLRWRSKTARSARQQARQRRRACRRSRMRRRLIQESRRIGLAAGDALECHGGEDPIAHRLFGQPVGAVTLLRLRGAGAAKLHAR